MRHVVGLRMRTAQKGMCPPTVEHRLFHTDNPNEEETARNYGFPALTGSLIEPRSDDSNFRFTKNRRQYEKLSIIR